MTAATDAVVGLVAPVDAGKTTLAEALLFHAGAIRRQGRVDHGDAHLDTHALERERGITIFAKQTALDHAGAHLMIVDTPGHVDFSAEMERVLPVLDYAVLVVSATDGVQGHTETLWELLARYRVPTILFINKMDLAVGDAAAVRGALARRLGAPLVAGGASPRRAAPPIARPPSRSRTPRPPMSVPSTSTSRRGRSPRRRCGAWWRSAPSSRVLRAPPSRARASRRCSTASRRACGNRCGPPPSVRACTA